MSGGIKRTVPVQAYQLAIINDSCRSMIIETLCTQSVDGVRVDINV